MIPLFAELPDMGYILIVCAVVAIIAGVGLVLILRFLQETRERLTKEIQIGLDQAKQATPVSVQQPLEVKAHEKLVTRDEHQALAARTREEHLALARRMDDELGRERGARKKIHEEIGVLQSSVARVETETTKQSEDLAEVKQDVKDMNARVDLVPERTINLLKTTGVIK